MKKSTYNIIEKFVLNNNMLRSFTALSLKTPLKTLKYNYSKNREIIKVTSLVICVALTNEMYKEKGYYGLLTKNIFLSDLKQILSEYPVQEMIHVAIIEISELGYKPNLTTQMYKDDLDNILQKFKDIWDKRSLLQDKQLIKQYDNFYKKLTSKTYDIIVNNSNNPFIISMKDIKNIIKNKNNIIYSYPLLNKSIIQTVEEDMLSRVYFINCNYKQVVDKLNGKFSANKILLEDLDIKDNID